MSNFGGPSSKKQAGVPQSSINLLQQKPKVGKGHSRKQSHMITDTKQDLTDDKSLNAHSAITSEKGNGLLIDDSTGQNLQEYVKKNRHHMASTARREPKNDNMLS